MRRFKKRYLCYVCALAYGVYWLFCLPAELFPQARSTMLLSAGGELLGAHVADDGQWRLPPIDSTPRVVRLAVLTYEDRTFKRHWGVSARGVLRAMRDNLRAGHVVSGGSTITMQVARMARRNPSRNLWQKFVEATWASRLEWRYDKEEILALWLNNAPFGGNVVGLEAAAYRYYGRAPATLTWAEAATLAVLPNRPGLIHPGRGRAVLLGKRNDLLDQLVEQNHLDADEAALAKLEPLPDKPYPLPRFAEHLLQRIQAEHGSDRYVSTLDAALQRRVTQLVAETGSMLARNEIHNCAALVTEVSTGRVLAYVGNVPGLADTHSPDVDILTAPRSPGSLLKPILYGVALNAGVLTPRELLPDVPVSFGGFQPKNFHPVFDGAVPADEALARSLNVPFVYLLRRYGLERFHADLRGFGFDNLDRPPGHYGLSLVLGGGEITAEQINGWFLGLARQQRYFGARQSRYSTNDFGLLHYLDAPPIDPLASLERHPGSIGAAAADRVLNALSTLERPNETGGTVRFRSHRRVAWKTGTSFGFRDAWASGCTPEYAVTVWAGNADGEGRQGLVGVRAAAPLMFRIFRLLEQRESHVPSNGGPSPTWFEIPYDDVVPTIVCAESGKIAGAHCPGREALLAPVAERSGKCTLHQSILVDGRGARVQWGCVNGNARPETRFVLPGRWAYYYRRNHADYRGLPPWAEGCGRRAGRPMQFVYPHPGGVLARSKDWLGNYGPVLFELAHQRPEAEVHWHLNGSYVRTTQLFHTVTFELEPGRHSVTAVDEQGNRLNRRFVLR